MLKQRLITAALLIPLVVLAILQSSNTLFQWLMAGITLLAVLEWLKIVGVRTRTEMVVAVCVTAGVAIASQLYLPVQVVLIFSALLWLVATLFVFYFAHKPLTNVVALLFKEKLFGIVVVMMVLIPFWLTAVILHDSSTLGPQQLLYVMVSIWLADSGGYFAGKRWGNQKLASVISPNKTWQGVYGALVLASAWAVIAYLLGINGSISLVGWLGLTVVTVLISVIGDLFESVFKRSHQVKDSGNLLPGHGGMLDRIDSLMAAVPVFVVGLALLGAI
ncbi:phosphatidate cytidylyltransferase [Methylophaga sp. 41_12_T18]|nr:phosphatidate cytidylyltransferase [Methylophaga sp. 41_12_T18]